MLDPETGMRPPGHRREGIADELETARDRMDAKAEGPPSRVATVLRANATEDQRGSPDPK